jgi:hypothetical protein
MAWQQSNGPQPLSPAAGLVVTAGVQAEGLTMPGPWGALYALAEWRKLRAAHRRAHPCCAMCLDAGVVTPVAVVDHIRPHRGNLRMFLDPTNLQSLCKPHHDSTKGWEERRGLSPGCDANGNPLDARHPWNRNGRASDAVREPRTPLHRAAKAGGEGG